MVPSMRAHRAHARRQKGVLRHLARDCLGRRAARLSELFDKVMRGGSFGNGTSGLPAGERGIAVTANRFSTIGARCARTP